MRRIFVSSVFVLVSGTLAQAASPTPVKAVAGVQGNHTYWLSEDLNRLVFWKAPKQRASTVQRAED